MENGQLHDHQDDVPVQMGDITKEFSRPHQPIEINTDIQEPNEDTIISGVAYRDRKRLCDIYNLIVERMGELYRYQWRLSEDANLLAKRATISKVVVIVLGALVATRETITALTGSGNVAANAVVIILYTIIGVLIAVLTGLEAAFRWGIKSGKLVALAAGCRTVRQLLKTELTLATPATLTIDEIAVTYKQSLEKLNTKLNELRLEIGELDINPITTVATEDTNPSDIDPLYSIRLPWEMTVPLLERLEYKIRSVESEKNRKRRDRILRGIS